MAGEKEIRSKIASVKNMQKITSAMEKVAASKIRKAQKQMEASRPYAERIRRVVGHLAHANPDYKHPFLVEREAKRVGYIVISTDRGLVRRSQRQPVQGSDWRAGKVERRERRSRLDTGWCQSGGVLQVAWAETSSVQQRISGDKPERQRPDRRDQNHARFAYSDGNIDRLYLVNNVFVSAMSQKPTVSQLLPASGVTEDAEDLQAHWDYIYEPDAGELLEEVLTRYIESQVYRGAVENFASEMAAKMVAMKSATDNAGEIIDKLQLEYNKARQAAITQEISEIVGGAAAVSG